MKKLLSKLVYTIVFFVCISVHAQRGLGTNNPEKSAILELKSTTKGFLPPRMTSAQLLKLKNNAPLEGLMVYCSDCPTKGMVVFDGITFISLGDGKTAHAFLTVTTATGKVWMDRNLGASQVATSSTDAASYGDSYQWGRNKDGHEQRSSATASGPATIGSEGASFITTSASPSDWLTPQDDARWGATKTANDPCPTGFRVPTDTELEAERNNGGTGFWGTGSAQNNAAGAFASVLKLPVAGYRNVTGALTNVGSYGYYWSSTFSGGNARRLHFSSSNSDMNASLRAHGFSVRCIKDFEFQTVTSTTGKVWMDRNLGASQVATSSTDEDSYGYHYQWGKKQEFAAAITTAAGPVADATAAGINFITINVAPNDWINPQNDALWNSGTVGAPVKVTANDPCPTGFRVPTDTELEAERNNGGTGFWGTGSEQNNAAGAFTSVLKLPVAGYRGSSTGGLANVGSLGYYWYSAVNGTNASYLYFNSSNASMNVGSRSYGFSVRCIKD